MAGSETADFFAANKERLISFGEHFVEKLGDRELIDNLAEKDLEKLARVFKLVFDKLDETEPAEENTALNAIIRAFSDKEVSE